MKRPLIEYDIIPAARGHQLAVLSWGDKKNIHIENHLTTTKGESRAFIHKKSKEILHERIMSLCAHRDGLLTTLRMGRNTKVSESITEIRRRLEFFGKAKYHSYLRMILQLEEDLRNLIPPEGYKARIRYERLIDEIITYCKKEVR